MQEILKGYLGIFIFFCWSVIILCAILSIQKNYYNPRTEIVQSDTITVDGTKFQTFKYRGTRHFKEIK